MPNGKLTAIFIAEQSAGKMLSLATVEAVAGEGLAGDRYQVGEGTFAKPGAVDRQLTLIEAEAIEGAAAEYELELTAAETRRNLVTRGVALNHLVGREFRIGEVVIRGIRLCEPCGHLGKMTSEEVKKSLIHRGGLRAEIVTGGTLSVGQEVLL